MNSSNSLKITNLVLYTYWRSSSSWRVRIALNLKNISHELKPTHLVKGEHKTDEFKKMSIIAKIPVLQFDLEKNDEIKRNYLPESMAICEFLEEAYPQTQKLFPDDLVVRAKVRAFCSEIACNIQPIQNMPVLNRIAEIGSDKSEWAKEWIGKGLDIVEKMVGETKGKYIFGDSITLADAFLIPQLYNARRFNVDMSNYTNILEVEKNLNVEEAFIKAHPDNQPDFEKA